MNLIALGKQGQITDEEKAEMERLIDLGSSDVITLRGIAPAETVWT